MTAIGTSQVDDEREKAAEAAWLAFRKDALGGPGPMEPLFRIGYMAGR